MLNRHIRETRLENMRDRLAAESQQQMEARLEQMNSYQHERLTAGSLQH